MKAISLKQKLLVIEEVEKGAKNTDIAKKFGIAPSTVSLILKNRAKIRESVYSGKNLNSKRNRPLKFEKIDDALIKWIRIMRSKNMPLSGSIIKEKSLQFAASFNETNFSASEGWLEKFKKRYNIVQKSLCGESADVDRQLGVSWIQNVLPQILSRYSEKNVFNADETGIFYKCLPEKTLAFKNEKCHGGKHSKERITCLVAANMTGSEKLRLVLIGKSANPRCFKGIKYLPVDYYSNRNSWMTSEIFEKVLLKFDKKFYNEKRKVALFIDNCPAHPKDISSKLKSIELIFFPPNMSSMLQPMDQGVIKNLKVYYRHRLLSKAIDDIDKEKTAKVSLLDSIRLLNKAWITDVKKETIKNCFKRAGFGEQWSDEDDIPIIEIQAQIRDQNVNNSVQRQLSLYIEKVGGHPIEFEDFIEIDRDVDVSYFPTDEEITRPESQPNHISDSDSSDEEINIVRPSDVEIKAALNTIRQFLEMEESTDHLIFQHFNAVEDFHQACAENNKKQSVITQFFQKNVNM